MSTLVVALLFAAPIPYPKPLTFEAGVPYTMMWGETRCSDIVWGKIGADTGFEADYDYKGLKFRSSFYWNPATRMLKIIDTSMNGFECHRVYEMKVDSQLRTDGIAKFIPYKRLP